MAYPKALTRPGECITMHREVVVSDRLARLRTLRDQLTVRLDECRSDHAFAQLSAQMTAVLAQIEDAEKALPAKEATPLDELRAKRAARQTKSPARSSRTKS